MNRFEDKLKEQSFDKTEFKHLPTKIKEQIEKSWQKIFDMDFEDEYSTSKMIDKRIQACCWEIKSEEILNIQKFTAR